MRVRLRLYAAEFRDGICQSGGGYIFSQRAMSIRHTYCCYLVQGVRELQIPHTIQSREYLKDGGAGDFPHIRGERERQPELPVSQQERQAMVPELELDRQ